MLGEVTAMQLYCIRLGRLIDEGKMSDTMASLAKMTSARSRPVTCAAMARDILGGNGILLDFHVPGTCATWRRSSPTRAPRVQTLIVGRDITGQSAFT